ncbi:hypothetical protein CPB83DRAFT_853541 [Crepidotus variabilis]|uniref:Uncharacterized protein n=1 Tax=Crepidotus variabilis TaxID=179855 RepID=A0A9P6JQ98_9AGAR|nr:hypothetical protein CPB83DRAFT_853541 [Crepidotus variabilis]
MFDSHPRVSSPSCLRLYLPLGFQSLIGLSRVLSPRFLNSWPVSIFLNCLTEVMSSHPRSRGIIDVSMSRSVEANRERDGKVRKPLLGLEKLNIDKRLCEPRSHERVIGIYGSYWLLSNRVERIPSSSSKNTSRSSCPRKANRVSSSPGSKRPWASFAHEMPREFLFIFCRSLEWNHFDATAYVDIIVVLLSQTA